MTPINKIYFKELDRQNSEIDKIKEMLAKAKAEKEKTMDLFFHTYYYDNLDLSKGKTVDFVVAESRFIQDKFLTELHILGKEFSKIGNELSEYTEEKDATILATNKKELTDFYLMLEKYIACINSRFEALQTITNRLERRVVLPEFTGQTVFVPEVDKSALATLGIPDDNIIYT